MKSRRPWLPRRVWFPNLLTTANLFCGFLAIIFIIRGLDPGDNGRGWYTWAAFTICLSALFDALDGRAARALHVASPFGKELDSLADVVSFGVAPAVLIYEHIFRDHQLPIASILMVALFVCCGAARLARYNVVGASGRFFTGMPIPAAGLTITGLAIFPADLPIELLAAVVLISAGLMISTLRYPNPEQLLFDAPLPIRIMFIGLFVIAVINPSGWFWPLPIAYITYGLLLSLLQVIRTRQV
ncbi:MAG: CDP-diacylglycerol--serine O-phosphatidyltransferase [Herpetosiphonaceae bacterium]|nr:CDP-diacylglycerol--serine O-phosphatidyltransferase [Herpetosiphonaceae bacterium]